MTVLPAGSVTPRPVPPDAAPQTAPMQVTSLGDAGGLTQFGALLVELRPGARSSERHWHEAEDEFLYVLSGRPTLIDNAGPQALAPGDALGWRAGVSNGHQLVNRSDGAVTFLILGTRVLGDVCHYPDSGDTQINEVETWRVVSRSGAVLRDGVLPDHLRDVPARWGQTAAAAPAPLIRRGTARTDHATPAKQAQGFGFAAALLSQTAGLTQFGAILETLPPGARSSERHWHEEEDEFLYLLEGTATAVENDGPHPLQPGDACAWKAGTPNAHHIVNNAQQPCTYLVAGTRWPHDRVHYAEVDMFYSRDPDGREARTRRDGSPLPQEG